MTSDQTNQKDRHSRSDSVDNQLTRLFDQDIDTGNSTEFASKVMQRIAIRARLRRGLLGSALLLGSVLATRAVPDLERLTDSLSARFNHALQGATDQLPALLSAVTDTQPLNSLSMLLVIALAATVFARWMED